MSVYQTSLYSEIDYEADGRQIGRLSLPWSVTCDQKLHDDAIARAYPTCADIPFASGFRSQPLPRLRLSVAASSRPSRANSTAMSSRALLRIKASIWLSSAAKRS